MTDKKYQDLYDDLYRSGYHANIKLCHSSIFFKDIMNFVKTIQNPKVLDVGCSIGQAVLYFKNRGVDSYGADISSVAIEKCKARGMDNCFAYPAHEMDFKDEFFDVVVCAEVLEHIPEEDIYKSIYEISRVCRSRVYLRIGLTKENNRRYDRIANKHSMKNLHVFVKSEEFWTSLLEKYFDSVVSYSKKGSMYFIGDKR